MSLKDDGTTRNKLFMAGIKVFAKKGYRDATVREICREAGSSNINSINYYFGSKEFLYREILDLIFKEYDIRKDPDFEEKSPEERLREFISTNCKLLYQGGAVESDLTTIFVAEMAKPSPFLVEMVDQYNRPRVERHLAMIRDIIGHDKPEETVRNCLVSISGQILYYSFAGPVFSRLFPEEAHTPAHNKLAEHVFKFSMGGLMAIKEGQKNGK
jgi:TetR/AcrR family transcriptional regulator, regulator of cefoperazone and chloramphenicol sensitivity